MNETNNKALTAEQQFYADFADKIDDIELYNKKGKPVKISETKLGWMLWCLLEKQTAALKEENERLKKEVCLFYSIQVKNLELQQQLSTMVEALEFCKTKIDSLECGCDDYNGFTCGKHAWQDKVNYNLEQYRQSKNEKGAEAPLPPAPKD